MREFTDDDRREFVRLMCAPRTRAIVDDIGKEMELSSRAAWALMRDREVLEALQQPDPTTFRFGRPREPMDATEVL